MPSKEYAEPIITSRFLSATNYQLLTHLYTAFFKSIIASRVAVDESAFRTMWRQLCESNETRLGQIKLSEIYLVLAIGGEMQPHPDKLAIGTDDLLQKLYNEAWTMLTDCLTISNIRTVKVLLLHVSQICYLPPLTYQKKGLLQHALWQIRVCLDAMWPCSPHFASHRVAQAHPPRP